MNSNLALKENTTPNYDSRNGKRGLTDDEVRQARNKYGENLISRKKKKGFLLSFLESFGDPIIKILLIALVINIIFLFHESSWFETIGIAIAILLATFVSTLSEYGSESAFEKLQEEAARIECRVYRADGLIQIPVNEIVVGDNILLQSGDRIPADGLIMEGNIDVDQSSLNGESKEVTKSPQSLIKKPGLSKDNFLNPTMLFSGTIVCSGEGVMEVTAVGDNTYYGRIGAEIQEETRESPLRIRLRGLAESIGKLGYVAALFSVCAYFFNNIILDNEFNLTLILKTVTTWSIMFPHLIKACTLAVTVIVMAVPEGLPMMITVVLSANMKRMLKDNVLVRKLVGIETAGSLNILFTDKTGTLTQGKLNVTHFIAGNGKVWNKNEVGINNSKIWQILNDSIQYNCAASLNQGVAIGGNATDRAMLEFTSNLKSNNKNIKKVNVIPFTSDLKYMATTISGDWNVTLVKGAPEKILTSCTKYYDEYGNVSPLANKSELDNILKHFAEKAVRMIAIAVTSNSGNTGSKNTNRFENLILVGLVGLRDEIRPDAVKGIQEVQSAGIQTVMITGDSAPTARAIAKEVGLIRNHSDLVITSNELNAMSDSTLSNKLPNLRVVARALPSDKSRLVRIAQEKGLVVGMTGDGVNDAPALKQADIGFAMGSGTEVAKEAGDIVILDDNFISISKAVCYGRTIFKSIRKFIIYQLSICMCAVGVTVIGPLIGIDSPITVIQMLWINIVMDTLAGLAFSGEKARLSYMNEQPKSRDEKIINPYMLQQITVNSIYSTCLCLFFLKSSAIQSLFGFQDDAYKMTAFFSLFMYSAIFTSFSARTHQMNLLDYLAANKPFILIMGFVTIIQTIIIYYGGTVFRTVKLDFNDLILVGLLAFSVIPVDLIRKSLLNKNSEVIGT
ncbi:calcium-translocating P-type ATPase, PMCA-type [Konateibacter massiliensis]|uniref:calcium-translocating P-type ATPase, PMCA-type n=1 Tax=Konateibacter massiliensis TaxID=2002841 RepID=UPI000C15C59C|nr:calcium-translocating P-type ATPase, PMCA-type [Konateibacter massiliensis]